MPIYISALIIILVSGALLGTLYFSTSLQQLPMVTLLLTIAIGASSMQSSMKTFGAERLEVYRDSSSGVNRFAYFCAKIARCAPP